MDSPAAIGMPSKYSSWRPYQAEAVLAFLSDNKTYSCHVCPTGFGKSLFYTAAAVMSGMRCLILTSTKTLQTQLVLDFGPIGMADIRGKNAYMCVKENGVSCDKAPCSAGIDCDIGCDMPDHATAGRTLSGCLYYDALRKASVSSLVVTNYACWMSLNEFAPGRLGHFDILVCDEAHHVPDVVSSYMTSSINVSDAFVKGLGPVPGSTDMKEWIRWGGMHADSIAASCRKLKNRIKAGWSYESMKELAKRLNILSTADTLSAVENASDWAAETVTGYAGRTVKFCPVWPAQYAQDVLFSNKAGSHNPRTRPVRQTHQSSVFEKVLLTSATIREKTLDMLGVSKEERSFTEYPHMFPKERRRITVVPVVRVNAKTSESGYSRLVSAVDRIIQKRSDRKGIVHTISYARAKMLVERSEFGSMMITHTSKGGDHEKAVSRFKASGMPAVLVSPSVGTGYDFPYSECEYQIILKVPYPDTRGDLMQARCRLDTDYAPYLAMLYLVQASGRGMRAADDSCETFVLDSNMQWFLPKYRHFAPEWFSGAVKWTSLFPPPNEKIKRRVQ